ncbi:hypothetical protein KILIM_079_00230 [Kineosphaera limosa NBRC 100340]|uniref:Uncharacterized protein n=1 Tax=Kineosphaera limosa NBRC 100340 TaxID=1184609 RepID=K6WEL1_9MICO|nr:hypothetical protein KILIM_079_00230 [Kineosphaera limosa NBRC 100340]
MFCDFLDSAGPGDLCGAGGFGVLRGVEVKRGACRDGLARGTPLASEGHLRHREVAWLSLLMLTAR